MSKAVTTPTNTLTAISQGIEIVRESVRPASAKEAIISNVCVATSRRCRFHRSTKMPANGVSTNDGTCDEKPMTPSRSVDPVRRYTSQLVAVVVIHVPVSETICPPKNRR